MVRRARGVRRVGSAALDLCYVAAGRLDAFWEYKLHAWDIAAGRLIVERAGGTATDTDGTSTPHLSTDRVHVLASNGRVHEALARILDTDAGARRVGEVGIGTNPQLGRHVLNTLLVEKIGGSFHLALGNAYSMSHYQGRPVQVDNGNRSGIHWDITTLLRGHGGRILVDDVPIMEAGRFTDPALAVLNDGWEALPADQRPGWWPHRVDPQGVRVTPPRLTPRQTGAKTPPNPQSPHPREG